MLFVALTDVAAEPMRLGSVARPELGADVRSWHLRASRERARSFDGVVERPRRFLIYRPVDVAVIAVGRVLHDAMELERRLRNPDVWG